ncbi:hypothetical protein Tco_0830013 [Tanacetum coccineum]
MLKYSKHASTMEFDQFVSQPGEATRVSLQSFAYLMNDLERNGIIFPKVTVNTKFLNCLQPEWLKANHQKQTKIINNIIGDDQIDSNIIFDTPNDDVNGSNVEYDNNAQKSYELEQFVRNAYKKAEKQQTIAKKVQQQNTMLTTQLELYTEKV